MRTIWWNTASQDYFDREILPYFSEVNDAKPEVILDIGASSGLFSIALCKHLPEAKVFAFEPSVRQRILLRRNVSTNGLIDRIAIQPSGLWNSTCELKFRTHGDLSSFEPASALPANYAFDEIVRVTTLDTWFRDSGLKQLELVKLDVEGAELEILEGASETLRALRPRLLIQAYHLRNGKRTFERCRSILEKLGYRCHETGDVTGMLSAIHVK